MKFNKHSKILKLKIYFLVFSFVFSSLAPTISLAREVESLEVPSLPATQVEETQVLALPMPEELKPTPVIVEEPAEIIPIESEGEIPEAPMATTDDPEPYIQKDEIKSLVDKLNIDTDSNTGAFNYAYPIEVPVGRNGLQPDLQLTYNNQNSDNQNLFGYGWSINIPYIERINKKGIDKIYSDPYFNSSLTGELVSIDANGGHSSKVDNGEFFDYEYASSTDTWIVKDKQGTVYTFGATINSRQDDLGDPTKVFKWMLEEIRDTNDNFIRYEYYKDNGQIYPYKIFYTGHSTTDGIFEVEFLREARNDNLNSFATGFNVYNDYRINEIEISVNNQWEKRYHLNYITGDNDNRSLLDNIVEGARDPNSGVMMAMPEDSFDYNIPEKTWTLSNYSYPSNCYGGSESITIADLNGDSLSDFLCLIHNGSNDEDDFAIYLNNGDGSWEEHLNPNVPITSAQTWLTEIFQLADFNGDGLIDFISGYSDYNGIFLNDGNLNWNREDGYGDNTWFDVAYYNYIDINNDGKVDKIRAWLNSSFNWQSEVYINNGSEFVRDHNYEINFPIGAGDPSAMPMDINGDGFVDFMDQNGVYINNADGTGWYLDSNYEALEIWHNFAGSGYVQVGKIMDINGDGLSDVVRKDLYNLTNGIFLNNGDGTWTEDNTYVIPVSLSSVYDYSARYTVSDMNGDGLVDWVDGMWGRIHLFDLEQEVDVMNTINISGGSQIDINYKSSAQYQDEAPGQVAMTAISGDEITMPATEFDYTNGAVGWAEQSDFMLPSTTWVDYRVLSLADLNGDNYPDIFYHIDANPNIRKTYINNGDGTWTDDPNCLPPIPARTYERGYLTLDVNGDGLNDISTWSTFYTNNGDCTWSPSTWPAPAVGFPTDTPLDSSSALVYVDVNGDSLLDVVYTNLTHDWREIYINQGPNGWQRDMEHDFPFQISTNNRFLSDVNQDGLGDMVQYSSFYINNGDFSLNQIPGYGSPTYLDKGGRLADVNGDGLVDILKSIDSVLLNGNGVYINNGDGSFDIDINYELPVYFAVQPDLFITERYGIFTIDMDADGLVDLVDFGNDKIYFNNSGDSEDIVNNIITEEGSEIGIEYQSSAQATSTSGLLNPELPFVVQTVSQITIDDGLGNISDIDYEYSDGQYYYDSNNPYDKKFAGFGKVEKTESDTKTVNYYHQGDDSNSSQGEYNDSYYKIGRQYRQEVYDASTDDLLKQQLYKWEEYDQGDDNKFVYNTQKANTNFVGTTKSTASQYQYSTSTGNLLVENNLGEVVINIGTGEVTNQLTGDEKDTDYDYAENTTKHILAAPKTKTISDTVDSKAQDLYYNNQAHGQVDKINLTKEDYITDDVELNRNFDSYGLVYEQSDPKFATTTLSYDSYNMYPASSTDPLGNTSYTDYNLLNGQIATSTTPNGAMTVNKFDAFSRLTETKISDPDNFGSLVLKQEVSYQDTVLPRHTETKNYFDSTNFVTSREYYDGLDRVIQSKSQTDNTSEYTAVDISYDSQGRVDRQSLPYITTAIDYSVPNLSQPAKTYIYDALGRVLIETTPVGTTGYDYDGFTTTITDANNNIKDLTKDAHGNLIEVKEYNDTSVYTTSYDYTLTNKLKKITDEQGNIRNFHYDDLDNLDWQDMVHKSTVTTPEKINYTHDKNGNVETETSFKGDNISYVYDDLNRVEYEKLDNVNKISYVYDEDGDIGQLTHAYYGNNNRRAYDYDILGNLRTSTTTIENEDFVMNFDYNLNGEAESITYPNGHVVSYGFNNIGQVDSVSLDKGSGPVVLVDNIQYNQNGQMTHLERSNGVITDYIYNPQENFRLTDLDTTHGTTTLQDIHYTYDAVGNITQITDSSSTDLAKTTWYDYDDLYRLASSTVNYISHPADNYSKVYNYDAVGNMIYNSDLGTMNYDNDNPHQLSSLTGRTFTYDDAGNTKTNNISKFIWDHRSRLDSTYDIASENNTYYDYDHNNQRFIKYTEELVWIPPDIEEICMIEAAMVGSDNSVRMAAGRRAGNWELRRVKEDKYVDGYFEKNLANQAKTHINVNNIKVATVNESDDPYFILGDHLGSSSLRTDSTGAVAELSDYKPFGKINYESTIQDLDNDYTFTGHEYDEENSLQYFGARYMDNEIGRFTAMEPVMLVLHDGNQLKKISGQELQNILSDPQALNSYSYSKNNPVIFVDPDGNWWKAFVWGNISTFGNGQSWSSFQTELGQAANQLYNDSDTAKAIMDNPGKSSLAIGVGSGLAAYGSSAAITWGLTEVGLIGGTAMTQADKALQSGRGWSPGRVADSAKNLVGHFEKQGDKIGAKNLGQYYQKANDFVQSGYTNVFKEGADKVYYNVNNNFSAILDANNKIKTFYKVENVNKISSYLDRISKIK
ncbi:MAG: hypothetical protein HOE19_04155 [Candidatus Komeilibacteria bacterium]|jgi:RHS repeat-associated protein|nr:hypothetical protein [Candidatus Komeilibacteria bacterium]MBT4447867.1 hypothetical protein [Candidatus Komeilibacteria bacterium]